MPCPLLSLARLVLELKTVIELVLVFAGVQYLNEAKDSFVGAFMQVGTPFEFGVVAPFYAAVCSSSSPELRLEASSPSRGLSLGPSFSTCRGVVCWIARACCRACCAKNPCAASASIW